MNIRTLPFVLLFAAAPAASGAELLVATVNGKDFQVPGSGNVQTVTFTTDQPITGIGFTALWSAVVADNQNGVAPWSIDLSVTVTAPDGTSQVFWDTIGGDVTIADYPLQDFLSGFEAVDGNGTFTWSFTSIGPPWVAGLSDVQYHLTTEVPDVVQVFEGSVAEGPLWHRPFFIAGISGLGPVIYDAMEFTVSASGGYEIESIVPTGNNFAYIYQGGFDPDNPLENLLDYGLGNGFSYDGSPQGTSRISAMLFEGETYHLVVSQWAATTPGQPYTNTVIGPGEFLVVGEPTPGDLNNDGVVNVSDLLILLGNWGPCPVGTACIGDLNDDGQVNVSDLLILLSNWG
jgi:hypothetical protein